MVHTRCQILRGAFEYRVANGLAYQLLVRPMMGEILQLEFIEFLS